jgi:hypothetical protein
MFTRTSILALALAGLFIGSPVQAAYSTGPDQARADAPAGVQFAAALNPQPLPPDRGDRNKQRRVKTFQSFKASPCSPDCK